jgi:hypothetical protein
MDLDEELSLALYAAMPAVYEKAVLLTDEMKGERKELFQHLRTLHMHITEARAFAWTGPIIVARGPTSVTLRNEGRRVISRPVSTEQVSATIQLDWTSRHVHVVWEGMRGFLPPTYGDKRPAQYDKHPTTITSDVDESIVSMHAIVDGVVRELDLLDPFGVAYLRKLRQEGVSRRFKQNIRARAERKKARLPGYTVSES